MPTFVAVPSYEVFIDPVLRCLAAHDGAVAARQVHEAAAHALSLDSDARAARLASGKLIYRDRAGWAFDRLKRAGLATAPQDGQWQLTTAGRELASGTRKLSPTQIDHIAKILPLRTGVSGRAAASSYPARGAQVLARAAFDDNHIKAYRRPPRPLSTGGQAEVYSAVRKRDGVSVAFKRAKNPLGDERMRREIEIQSKLVHRNVMPILASDASFRWYVMPLGRRPMSSLTRPIENVTIRQIVCDVIAALECAHALGITHRDVKPANIIELEDSEHGTRWVLADWGMTKRAPGETTEKLTATGEFVGTEGFGPPESYSDAHSFGPPGDIYSLGQVIAWATGVDPVPNIPATPVEPWLSVVRPMTRLAAADRPQAIGDVRALIAALPSFDPSGNPAPSSSPNNS
jgi:hypothetical protein